MIYLAKLIVQVRNLLIKFQVIDPFHLRREIDTGLTGIYLLMLSLCDWIFEFGVYHSILRWRLTSCQINGNSLGDVLFALIYSLNKELTVPFQLCGLIDKCKFISRWIISLNLSINQGGKWVIQRKLDNKCRINGNLEADTLFSRMYALVFKVMLSFHIKRDIWCWIKGSLQADTLFSWS